MTSLGRTIRAYICFSQFMFAENILTKSTSSNLLNQRYYYTFNNKKMQLHNDLPSKGDRLTEKFA